MTEGPALNEQRKAKLLTGVSIGAFLVLGAVMLWIVHVQHPSGLTPAEKATIAADQKRGWETMARTPTIHLYLAPTDGHSPVAPMFDVLNANNELIDKALLDEQAKRQDLERRLALLEQRRNNDSK